MPELPELLLPAPVVDVDAALLAAEAVAVDAELALFSRDVVMFVDLGFPKLTVTLPPPPPPPPVPALLPPLVLKENIGWPRSTNRLEDGPPSSTEEEDEWPPGNASEWSDPGKINQLIKKFAQLVQY